MTSADATKKCPYCAEEIKAEAVFCRFCQKDLSAPAKAALPTTLPQVPPTPAPAYQQPVYQQPPAYQQPVYQQPMYQQPYTPPQKSRGIGLSLSSIIVSVVAIVIALADLGSVSNHTYAYIASSEVGLLWVITLVGCGLASGARFKKNQAWVGAVVLGIIAIGLTMSVSGHQPPAGYY